MARLRERALADGVGRITMMDDVLPRGEVSGQLTGHPSLDRAVVVVGSEAEVEVEVENRRAFLRAAASFVGAEVKPGGTFGLLRGRTLAGNGEYLDVLPTSRVVSLIPAVGHKGDNSAVDILRTVARGW